MSLQAIATKLATGPAQDEIEDDLRACFVNLLNGIDRHCISLRAAQRRLSYMIQMFGASATQDRAALRLAHMESLKVFDEADHYERPGPLSDYLNMRAVTIQASEDGLLGEIWMGRRARAPRIVEAFKAGNCDGTVGPPGKPLWITPYTGEIKALCEEARERSCGRARRIEIARRAVGLLGLVHIRAKDEVIAMVTDKTIAQLGFDHPDTGNPTMPVGPTAVEARGHRRFRQWPRRAITDFYGRTYELDGAIRARIDPRDNHGASEAVRPAVPIEQFAECIYLGTLSDPDFDDEQAEYLRSLGAAHSIDLLRELSRVTGL